MELRPRITHVEAREQFVVQLGFKDGSEGTVDIAELVGTFDGVFEPFLDPSFFARVTVDHEAGTIVWPNGVDLDPDVLYEKAHGILPA